MILLIGLVTKNSILLVEYTNQLRERGHGARSDAVLESGRIRLRPILMTSVATIIGAVPIALGLGAGSMQPAAAGLRHRRRRALLDRPHAVPRAGGVRAARRAAGAAHPSHRWRRPVARSRRRRSDRTRSFSCPGRRRAPIGAPPRHAASHHARRGDPPLGSARPGLRARPRPDRQCRVGPAGGRHRLLRALDRPRAE